VTVDRSQTAPPAQWRRGLRALVAATGVSSAGDGAFIAAAPLAAAVITRDPAAVATVTAAEYLPWVLVAPFAGYYVDRWPKRTMMIVADLVRVVLVTVLALMVASDSASVPAIAACAFAIVTGNVFHSAAAEAMIADLTALDDKLLHVTNGRQQAAYTAGRQLAGPPVGSLTFSVAGWLPFAFDAFSFLASAALLGFTPRRQATGPHKNGVWRTLRDSTAYLFAHRDLRTLALLTAVANFSINMVMGILVLYATDSGGLGIAEAGYGLLLVAMAVGGVAGGFLAARVVGWLGSRATMITGLAAQGGAWLVLATTGNAIVAGAALALGSVGVALVSVVVMTARQKQAPPELLGQVISAFRVVGNGPAPLGALAGGAMAEVAGLRLPIFVAVLLVLKVRPRVGQ
jgi:MFS family permease